MCASMVTGHRGMGDRGNIRRGHVPSAQAKADQKTADRKPSLVMRGGFFLVFLSMGNLVEDVK